MQAFVSPLDIYSFTKSSFSLTGLGFGRILLASMHLIGQEEQTGNNSAAAAAWAGGILNPSALSLVPLFGNGGKTNYFKAVSSFPLVMPQKRPCCIIIRSQVLKSLSFHFGQLERSHTMSVRIGHIILIVLVFELDGI